MLFNSVSYIIFLPICVVCYYVLPHKVKNLFLLLASYYFYMCWMPQYALLIGFSTVITWLTGFGIEKINNYAHRKCMLGINIIINLGILFVFKYFNFFVGTLEAVAGGAFNFPKTNLLLPVGISFYTFQALGYSIDVYKGEERGGICHEKNFLNYALFVSFFPQLVAGPIERSKNLLPQFREQHNFSTDRTVEGLRIILVGMYKKVVIADMAALVVDKIFAGYMELTGLTLLFGVFLFTIQIYCDFSGYSDVARGSARIFGFTLMENFKAPYMSASIREFWNRWHISLSTWFKDYVYIPLGGSRKGAGRKYLNLMIVFLVSGIWHGANYTYVLWGILHGIYRVVEEFFRKRIKGKGIQVFLQKKCMIVLRTGFVFVMVMLFWTYFRAEGIRQGNWFITHYLKGINMPVFVGECVTIIKQVMPDVFGIGTVYVAIMAFSILLLLISDWCYKYKNISASQMVASLPLILRWICYYAMIILIMFSFIMCTNEYGQAGAFLYFQF